MDTSQFAFIPLSIKALFVFFTPWIFVSFPNPFTSSLVGAHPLESFPQIDLRFCLPFIVRYFLASFILPLFTLSIKVSFVCCTPWILFLCPNPFTSSLEETPLPESFDQIDLMYCTTVRSQILLSLPLSYLFTLFQRGFFCLLCTMKPCLVPNVFHFFFGRSPLIKLI